MFAKETVFRHGNHGGLRLFAAAGLQHDRHVTHLASLTSDHQFTSSTKRIGKS